MVIDMTNYAVVENGKVIDLSVWDGESDWSPDVGEAIMAPDDVGIGWSYASGAFTAPKVLAPEKTHDELVAEVEAEKNARIEEAKSKILVWQTKLLMGRTLNTAENAALNLWVDYIDAVGAVEAIRAPDIAWPPKPE